jgi:hypothetical protein
MQKQLEIAAVDVASDLAHTTDCDLAMQTRRSSCILSC